MILAAALVSLVMAADPAPQNPYLDATERLYLNLELEDAQRMLQKASSWPGNTPKDDVRVALFEGIIHAELGTRDGAVSAFRRGLAIDPAAVLPVKVAPKIVSLFDEAKRGLGLVSRPPDGAATASRVPNEASPSRSGLVLGATAISNVVAATLGAEVHGGYQLGHLDLSLRSRLGPRLGVGGLLAWGFDFGGFRAALGARADAYPGASSFGFGPAVAARLGLAADLGATAGASLELFSTKPPFPAVAVVLGAGLDWRPGR